MGEDGGMGRKIFLLLASVTSFFPAPSLSLSGCDTSTFWLLTGVSCCSNCCLLFCSVALFQGFSGSRNSCGSICLNMSCSSVVLSVTCSLSGSDSASATLGGASSAAPSFMCWKSCFSSCVRSVTSSRSSMPLLLLLLLLSLLPPPPLLSASSATTSASK